MCENLAAITGAASRDADAHIVTGRRCTNVTVIESQGEMDVPNTRPNTSCTIIEIAVNTNRSGCCGLHLHGTPGIGAGMRVATAGGLYVNDGVNQSRANPFLSCNSCCEGLNVAAVVSCVVSPVVMVRSSEGRGRDKRGRDNSRSNNLEH